ncbi:acyltransferase domain-containing protein, partial [Streptomyces spectabilis]
SFGISGTNAHLILEQAPATTPPANDGAGDPVLDAGAVLVPLSAKTGPALRVQAQRLHRYATETPQSAPADIGFSLATTRATFDHRAVVIAGDRDQLLSGLDALATDRSIPYVVAGAVDPRRGKTVFVCSGQDSQYPAMAAGLYTASAVFRKHIHACAEALAPFVDWSLIDVITGTDQTSCLDRVDVVQPALWAVMTSLGHLWRSCGIHPDAVIGHSQGEVAAAYLCGGLTLTDAARVIAVRAKALTALSGRGGMATVHQSSTCTEQLLAPYAGQLHIAAINSSATTVIAGAPDSLEQFLHTCHNNDIRARRIPVQYAAHTSHVEPIQQALLHDLADITPQPGHTPFYSTITATPHDTSSLEADYWYRNLREPVQFHTTAQALLADGHRTFLELSPHPILTPAIKEISANGHPEPGLVLGTLRRGHNDVTEFLTAAARLHAHGLPITWNTLFQGQNPQ